MLRQVNIFILAAFTIFCNIDVLKSQDTLHFNGMKDFTDFLTRDYIQKYPQVNFFKYKLITATTNIYDYYKGTLSDSTCDALKYMALINDLNNSSFKEESVINLEYLQSKMTSIALENKMPFSLCFVKYHDYKDSAIALNTIGFQNNQYVDNSPSGFFPFKENYLFSSASLNQVFESNTINFKFSDDVFFTNVPKDSISNIQVDFSDGIGFVPLARNSNFSVSYSTAGTKTIYCKIKYKGVDYFSSSSIILQSSAFSIQSNSCPKPPPSSLVPDFGPNPISTNILGNPVSGEYAIWYGSGNTQKKIRKPYIVTAGFNPYNGKKFLSGLINTSYYTFNLLNNTIQIPVAFSWNGEFRGTFYETYNGIWNNRFSPAEHCQFGENANSNNYLNRLRDEGYDVIILGFDDGTDNTVDNAALLMHLIEVVNNQKFANGSFIENVVSGYSGGGITSRLALALMESRFQNNLGPHPHTKLWVSFEGEHQGANVPLGLQYSILFQSNPSYIAPAVPIGLGLAKQSADIINQFAANLTKGAVFNPTTDELIAFNAQNNNQPMPARASLYSYIANIPNNSSGYPDFCRRVGVSQGSGKGSQVPYTNQLGFAAKLGFDAGTGTAVSYPSTCGGSYTWKMPNWAKENKASWWGNINGSGNIFQGVGYIDLGFTILPKVCVDVPFVGCQCTGPVNVNAYISLYNTTVPKPANPVNYDDSPSSTLSTHLEMYQYSAFHYYNNVLAGNSSYANHDPNLHAFSTTGSCLDLHDPNNNYQPANNFLSPNSLGLLYRNRDINNPNILVVEPNKRFGFPHLFYPTTHHQVTPFDGIYNIGDNNSVDINNNPWPDNQIHVETPQEFIGDYLARIEVAPEDLYISNRTIGSTSSNYTAEFESRNKIIVGKNDFNNPTRSIYSINAYDHYLTADGDFIVNNNSKAIFHCGDEIQLHPGFSVDLGSELDAYILPYNWSNQLFRPSAPTNNQSGGLLLGELSSVSFAPSKAIENSLAKQMIFPNPSSGLVNVVASGSDILNLKVFDINGKIMLERNLNASKSEINLEHLPNGIYFIEIEDVNKNKQFFKCVISK